MLLTALSILAFAASNTLAQPAPPSRTTITVSANGTSGMSLPIWYLKDLVTSHPGGESTRITFDLVRNSDDSAAIVKTTCNLTYTAARPPQRLQLCDDGETYWRTPLEREFAWNDFWIEVIRPSYIGPSGPIGTKDFVHWIKIEHGAVHLAAPALQCGDAASGAPRNLCTLASQRFATTDDASSSLASVFQYYDQGQFVNVTDFTALQTAPGPAGVQTGATFTVNEKADTTRCSFHGADAPLPTVRNPQACENSAFTWWTEQSRLGWAAGSSIRIQKRWTVRVDRGVAGLGMWEVQFELQYVFPLVDRPTFDYWCDNNVCEGVSAQPGAAGHVFWAEPGHIVLTL